jgi:hypothetical protein
MPESFSIMMAAYMHNEYCKHHDIQLFDLKIKVFLSNFARYYDGMKSWDDALDVDARRNRPSDDDSSVDDEDL